MTSNRETAQLLRRVAAVFRVLEGDTFRYKAYENAATAIENSAESIYELWQQNLLGTVPGIGKSLSKYISELYKKGSVRHFNSKFKKVPAGMFPLMDIRGIGPITAYKIAKKFKLTDEKTAIDELKDLIGQGRLGEISSFKEKTIKKIKKALDIKAKTKTARLLLSEALAIADDYLLFLKQSPVILKAESLGSLRRKVATVGDIDLAICTNNPSQGMEYALSYPKVYAVITKGEVLSHVKLKNGYEVDIKHSFPDEWGSLLQHYTGSKMHNIRLRTIALSKDLSLSEHGIKKGTRLFKFTDEKSFYKYLGMSFIPEEMREDKGEIEQAIKKEKFDILEQKDIKGDLHIHSNFKYPSSHDTGQSTLEEILLEAEKSGYEYVGISDHNPKTSEMSESQRNNIINDYINFLKHEYHAYENKVKNRIIKLLIGMEVDIKTDGSLALSDLLMEKLDYVIISIHSGFDQDMNKNTERILKALSHPKAIILGHPTGRILNEREPINADWKKIFSYCRQNKKMLEINADPRRLDLPDDLIRQAISEEVSMVINTDSHHVSQLSNSKYGVWQSRRAGAKKSNIANTKSYKDFTRMINL